MSVVEFEELGTVTAGYNGLAEEVYTGKTIDVPVYMLKGHKTLVRAYPQLLCFVTKFVTNFYPRLLTLLIIYVIIKVQQSKPPLIAVRGNALNKPHSI